MAVIETWLTQELQEPVQVRQLCGNFFSHNGNANRIGVKVFDNGSPATLSGTVSGYAVLPDGTTVPCTGSLSGNQASVLLPAAAYVPGNICVTIMLTSGTTVTTLAALTGTVVRARTDTQVNPGSVVTDWTNTINAALQTVEGYTGNIIATPYASLTYPVPLGKYCIYNNLLYRCISPISTSESWTASHWAQVKLADDVADLKSALNKSESTSDELAMEYNAAYSANDFDMVVSGLSISVSDSQIVMTNSGAANDYYSAMLSHRNYLNFDTSGYFILAYKKPSWASKYYALCVLPSSGGLRSLVIDYNTIRSYSQSLSVGSDSSKMIRAYKDGNNLIVYLQGQKNVVDLSDYPIIPEDTSKGYWSIDDFSFGVAMVGTSKTINYKSNNIPMKNEAMIYGGVLNSNHTEWGTLTPNRWYNVPFVQGRTLPDIFSQYNVDRGILEIFKPTITYSALYRFTGGSNNAQFLARSDSGTMTDWKLSFVTGRISTRPDYSSLRYVKQATSLDDCVSVGTYNVPNTVTLPEAFTEKGITNGILLVVNGFAQQAAYIMQIFIAGSRDYVFTRYAGVNSSTGLIENASAWKKLVTPNATNDLFSENVYYALGDSITAGSWSEDDGTAHAETDAAWAYCRQIANALGCTLHNLGIPGYSSGGILEEEVPGVDDDATLITVMCGTNDYRVHYPLGTSEDTTTGTTCGNLYQIIYQLMQTAPKARIIVLSPIPGATITRDPVTHEITSISYKRTTKNQATIPWDYNDLLVQYSALCKKYGVEFVDVLDNGPINNFNLPDMLGDGSHPKKDTYDSLAQYIFSQIF